MATYQAETVCSMCKGTGAFVDLNDMRVTKTGAPGYRARGQNVYVVATGGIGDLYAPGPDGSLTVRIDPARTPFHVHQCLCSTRGEGT